MLSILVETGVDLESKGAQWLLLVLEEAELAAREERKFTVAGYLRWLGVEYGPEYRAVDLAMKRVLFKAGYTKSVGTFIKGALEKKSW